MLNDIYSVVDSCSYNSDNFWCPIILKVGEMLREKSKETKFEKKKFQIKNKMKDFLL